MKNKAYLFPVALALLILIIDQWVKYYIKTHFFPGEEVNVIGEWFRLHFTENYGMAFGLEFGGKTGKILLTVFRIAAVVIGGWYIFQQIQKAAPKGYIVACALIWSGAVGNIVDSVFYGVWFGYDTWMHGRVVDMFYFPLIQTTVPDWFPFWKGEDFEFFRPVFNVADAAISIGFIMILLFNRTYLNKPDAIAEAPETLSDHTQA
jgi:signal peptidase II